VDFDLRDQLMEPKAQGLILPLLVMEKSPLPTSLSCRKGLSPELWSN
jgi:hypothetical protein